MRVISIIFSLWKSNIDLESTYDIFRFSANFSAFWAILWLMPEKISRCIASVLRGNN